ncbi:hypothetical protein [Streptomyces aurantiacus]|nr:hypothetical protein [Streptomyces aurantiacus]
MPIEVPCHEFTPGLGDPAAPADFGRAVRSAYGRSPSEVRVLR